jgi:hypothetical protein
MDKSKINDTIVYLRMMGVKMEQISTAEEITGGYNEEDGYYVDLVYSNGYVPIGENLTEENCDFLVNKVASDLSIPITQYWK